MRLEDKELEGPDLERAQRLEVLEQTPEKDRELPQATGEVVDVELEHRSRLFDALQLLLSGGELDISLLYLPARESLALEALQAAIQGRDSLGQFVYAEDRAALLEQALAVLQQNLTHGSASELAALHAKYDELTDELATVRESLLDLEDAQDDLIDGRTEAPKAVAGDTADKPDESVTGFIASALQALAAVAGTDVTRLQSTAYDPDARELPDAPKPASTLGGAERAFTRPPSGLATGPEVPDKITSPSTLDGPEATRPEFVSTLDGPERPAPEKRSTLLTEGMSKLILPPDQRTPQLHDASPQSRKASGSMNPESALQAPTGSRLEQMAAKEATEPPTRKSSPTIDPRKGFPSAAPPARTGSASVPPPIKERANDERDRFMKMRIGGDEQEAEEDVPSGEPVHPASKLGETRRGLSMRSTSSPPLARDGSTSERGSEKPPVPDSGPLVSYDPPAEAEAEPPAVGKPTRRGLAVRSTEKQDPKKK